MGKKKAFLVCPVRNVSEDYEDEIKRLKETLETEYDVHCPPYDTNQDDPYGTRIICENKNALKKSDEVFVFYDPESEGSLFDFGVAAYLDKPIYFLNCRPPEEVINRVDRIKQTKRDIEEEKSLSITGDPGEKDKIWLGALFGSGKEIYLEDREKIELDDHKSFKNALFVLDAFYRGDIPEQIQGEERDKMERYLEELQYWV